MEKHITWYVPQRVIYFSYPQKLTVESLSQILDDVMVLLNEVDHPVYVISDSTNIKSYPVNVNQIKAVVNLIKHPNYLAVNINNNRAITFMSSFVPKMLGTKIQVRDTGSLEEAIDYIKSQDSTIDWSLANKASIN